MPSHQWRDGQKGIGLILSMLFLFLLSLLGGALLTITTLDVRIGDNYKTASQLVYLAEAGVEDGRELLRTSALTPSQLLAAAAGGDGMLSVVRDPEVLLNGPTDRPMIDNQLLRDTAGNPVGHYSVFLKNDLVDGRVSAFDTNHALTLLSVGVMGSARKVLEAEVSRTGFPPLMAAVTVGVAVPQLDFRLKMPERTERLVAGILANATDVYNPALGGTTVLGSVGDSNDYRVVVVNGDCEFGSGAGYGLLLVRGELTMQGNFAWNGLILVIGQGTMRWPAASYGIISGAVFISKTRADDRNPANPLGSVLSAPGPAVADFLGQGFATFDPGEVDRANQRFPYVATSYREY